MVSMAVGRAGQTCTGGMRRRHQEARERGCLYEPPPPAIDVRCRGPAQIPSDIVASDAAVTRRHSNHLAAQPGQRRIDGQDRNIEVEGLCGQKTIERIAMDERERAG